MELVLTLQRHYAFAIADVRYRLGLDSTAWWAAPSFQLKFQRTGRQRLCTGGCYYRDIFGGRHSCGFINEIGIELNRSDPSRLHPEYTEERDEIE